jgi:tetratricopeptide (TPR) repeat protein
LTIPLDLLGGLANKSLVLLDGVGPDAEHGLYRLLETVRQYGQERLVAVGEGAAVRDAHLAYFLALAEEAAPLLTGSEAGWWLARLEAEHDNLRAALGWAREQGEGERGLRLAGALWRFWYMHGHLTEGRGWLEAVLASDGTASAASRATALNGTGVLAAGLGAYARAAVLHEEALAVRRALGNKDGITSSLNHLGVVAQAQGDYARALALYEEALALYRELEDQMGIAACLNHLGEVARAQGDCPRALALSEEAQALQRALGDKQGIAGSLNTLGLVAQEQGDYARAAALHEESLALFRHLDHKGGIAVSLRYLGEVACQQGDLAQAVALVEESLLLSRDSGARFWVAAGLETLAWVAAAHAQQQRVARLAAAAEALRESLGVPLLPEQRAGHDQAVQAMRVALGEEAFAAAWAAGRALSMEEAIELALQDDVRSRAVAVRVAEHR